MHFHCTEAATVMKIHHQRRPRCGTEAKDKHGLGRVKKLIFVNDFRGWMTLRTKQNRWHRPIPRRLAIVLNSLEKGYQGRWPSVYNADKMRIPLDVWKNESQLKWCGYGSRGVNASGWGTVPSLSYAANAGVAMHGRGWSILISYACCQIDSTSRPTAIDIHGQIVKLVSWRVSYLTV